MPTPSSSPRRGRGSGRHAPPSSNVAQIAVEIDDEDLQVVRTPLSRREDFAAGHGCSVDWERAIRRGLREPSLDDLRPAARLARSPTATPTSPRRHCRSGDLRKGRRPTRSRAARLLRSYEAWIARPGEAATTLDASSRRSPRSTSRDAARRSLASGRASTSSTTIRRPGRRFGSRAERCGTSALARHGFAAEKPTPEPGYRRTPRVATVPARLHPSVPRGLVDSSHGDREIADLLWFPTGGGKTEAYLGLIAFVVFLRRLRNEVGDGVTVLMRYTLRLLTIQQFDRASL